MINLFEALGGLLAPVSGESDIPFVGLAEIRVLEVDYLVSRVDEIVENLPETSNQIGRRVSKIAFTSDAVLADTVELEAQALEIHDRAKIMREERDAQTTREMALGLGEDRIKLHENTEDVIAGINTGIDMLTTPTPLEKAIIDKENELRASKEKIDEITATLHALYEAQDDQFTMAA